MPNPGGHTRGNRRAHQRYSEAIETRREVIRRNQEVIRSNQEGPSVHACTSVLVHHNGTHLGETLCEGFLVRLFDGQVCVAVELRPQCPPVPPPTVAVCQPRLSHRIQDVAGSLARLSLKGHLQIPVKRLPINVASSCDQRGRVSVPYASAHQKAIQRAIRAMSPSHGCN